jgi:hypothetical protein
MVRAVARMFTGSGAQDWPPAEEAFAHPEQQSLLDVLQELQVDDLEERSRRRSRADATSESSPTSIAVHASCVDRNSASSQEALAFLRDQIPRLDVDAIWAAELAARRARRLT